jgi:hypothetical protein
MAFISFPAGVLSAPTLTILSFQFDKRYLNLYSYTGSTQHLEGTSGQRQIDHIFLLDGYKHSATLYSMKRR